MRKERLRQSLHLLMTRSIRKRTQYVKENNIFYTMGENCVWGPWLVPLYPKMIKLHNNVVVHKTAKIVTHDVINGFLKKSRPDCDFGPEERVGCVELMDNVYIAMNVTVMPDVRIGPNCIITAGSVVTSDIPENSIASGNPAKVIGRFDMYMALRRMGKGSMIPFKNQELPESVADEMWSRFEKKHAVADLKKQSESDNR